MNIGPNAVLTPVHTAAFPGVVSFIVAPNPGGQVLAVNGTAVSVGSTLGGTPGAQASYTVYLNAGDVVSYQGPAAVLFCS